MAAYADEVVIPYDRDLGPVLFAHYADDMARRAVRMQPSNVLEIAAGTGIVTRQLRTRMAPAARLTALDISESMMGVARTKFHDGEQITFMQADATALPFADASFDTVLCQFGVMFFDRQAGFREAYRTLCPGGRFLFSVWDSEHYNPFASLSFQVLKLFFSEDPPRFLFDPVACHRIDPLKEMLLQTGFEAVTISVLRHEYILSDVDAFARALIFSPLIFEIQARGGDPERIASTLAQAFREDLGSDPVRYPMQAILFEAEKPS